MSDTTTLPCPEPHAPFAEVVEAVALWYRHFLAMQPNDYHGRHWAERMVESSLVMLYRRWDRWEILADGVRLYYARQDCSRQACSPQERRNRQTMQPGARLPPKNTAGNGLQLPVRQMDLF